MDADWGDLAHDADTAEVLAAVGDGAVSREARGRLDSVATDASAARREEEERRLEAKELSAALEASVPTRAPFRLYVASLPYSASAADIERSLDQAIGGGLRVLGIDIPLREGKSRGTAFVTVAERDMMLSLLRLSPPPRVGNRTVVLQVAKSSGPSGADRSRTSRRGGPSSSVSHTAGAPMQQQQQHQHHQHQRVGRTGGAFGANNRGRGRGRGFGGGSDAVEESDERFAAFRDRSGSNARSTAGTAPAAPTAETSDAAKDEDSAPTQRRRLQLKPRTVDAPVGSLSDRTRKGIFGAGRPRPVAASSTEAAKPSADSTSAAGQHETSTQVTSQQQEPLQQAQPSQRRSRGGGGGRREPRQTGGGGGGAPRRGGRRGGAGRRGTTEPAAPETEEGLVRSGGRKQRTIPMSRARIASAQETARSAEQRERDLTAANAFAALLSDDSESDSDDDTSVDEADAQ